MMTKFRWHRGGYEESMATVQKCHCMDELEYILKTGGFYGKIDVLKYCGTDPRNGWDTYLVLVDGEPVGFADGGFDG